MQPKEFMTDFNKGLAETFTKNVQATTRFYEDFGRTWTDSFGGRMTEFQTQWERMNDEFLPFARRNFERMQRHVDEQTQRNVKMLKESFDVNAPTTPTEMVDRFATGYRHGVEFVRESFDAFAKTQTDFFANFNDFFRTRMTFNEPTPVRKPAPAK